MIHYSIDIYIHILSSISPSCSWSWTACTSTCRPSSSPARGTYKGATTSPPCSPFCWRRCPGSHPPCRRCGGGRGRRFCHSPSPSWQSSLPPGYPQWCPAVITWRSQVISVFDVQCSKKSPRTHPVPRGLLLFCPPPTAPEAYCSPGRKEIF